MGEQRKKILEAIEDIHERETAFSKQAYFFIHKTWNFIFEEKNSKFQNEDIPTEEFLKGFKILALKEFGPMTFAVMQKWGIRSCEDIGRIILLLADEGQFLKTSVNLERFEQGFSFQEAFVLPYQKENSTKKEK